MAQTDHVDIGKTDLGSLLNDLAGRIRRDGAAVAGLAYRHADVGTVEHADLMSVTVSLERTAALVKAVEERLCQQCRVLSVVEWVGFGKVGE